MPTKADELFKEFPTMFCDEFEPGHQLFKSWEQFLYNVTHHLNADRPMYVFKATVDSSKVIDSAIVVHVDVSEIIEVPWHLLEELI